MDFFMNLLQKLADFLKIIFGLVGEDTSKIPTFKEEEETTETA